MSAPNRLDALEARLAALEHQPPAPRWLGVWRHGNEYSVGDLVTRSGGLWLACRPTSGKPGADDSGWSLIVKSGGAPVETDR